MRTETAFERLTAALERHTGYQPNGNKNWRCPAHEDSKASLTVAQGDGKVLVHCQAGCPTERVVETVGLTLADLFDDAGEQPEPTGEWTPRGPAIAVYDYVDENDVLLYAVCRTADKQFPVRRPDSTKRHGWSWNLPAEIRRVLYRLPRVMGAVMEGDPIYVVEGEKDVHSIEAHGATATCNPGGAGKWRDDYTKALAGARVRVVADLDSAEKNHAGQNHARRVASELAGVATSVEILAPATGKDVTDHLRAGLTLEDLQPLGDVDEEPPESEPIEPEPLEDDTGDGPRWFHVTDYGNAERLVAASGEDLRYCHPWGCWLAWDGRRWVRDDSAEAWRRAKGAVRDMYAELPLLSSKRRKALSLWAVRSEADPRIRAMLHLASSEKGIPVLPEDLDADPWLLNLQNGTLDLRTAELRPHRREDLITKMAPVDWDPEADWDGWAEFLDRVTGGNADLANFLQRAVGYSLTGSVAEQVMFVLHGTGANGKSTFSETVRALLGDYAQQTPADTLLERRDNAIPNDIARLRGARFISAVESEEGKRLAEGMVKQLTGGDVVTARFMRAEFFEFKPVGKIWLATNHLPKVHGTDEAIWRRLRLVPFTVTIPEPERDPDLGEKLRGELAGVLQWAVLGCLEWQQRRLGRPTAITEATALYRAGEDLLAPFLAECCIIDQHCTEQAKRVYDRYEEWARNGGELVLKQRRFSDRMAEKGFAKQKWGKSNLVHWVGLRLRRDDELLGP